MVKWTAHALGQLQLIHDYIAQDSPIYAKRVAENIVAKTLRLEHLPRLGRVVPEINEDCIRELSIYSYRVLYEIKQARVDILAVIHKRRDLQTDDIPREIA